MSNDIYQQRQFFEESKNKDIIPKSWGVDRLIMPEQDLQMEIKLHSIYLPNRNWKADTNK